MREGQAATVVGSCGLAQPAFCETFDAPAPTGSRSGPLNGILWGVSRTTGNTNLGSPADGWSQTQLDACGTTRTVTPPNDIALCNGQLREATNDGGTMTSLAIYPKQPFDIAGRVGIVAFDVSNDSQGSHAAWPEFWYTDKPIPDPFAHEASWTALPQHGLGVRFAGGCPLTNDPTTFTVDSAIVVSNYVANDSFNGGNLRIDQLDCAKLSTGPNGGLNHIELHISQSQTDVYATDAGTTSPLRHIATVHANLTLTRGLIWLEDVHYNADKFNSQGTHTFAWDNVGFDGPVLARDLTFDVPDHLAADGGGVYELGWAAAANQPLNFSVGGVTNVESAVAAYVLLSAYSYSTGYTFSYSLNGHSHIYTWPFPASVPGYAWNTFALPLALSEVVAGTNALVLSANAGVDVANIDLLLAGAGGVPGLPPPLPTATATPTPTATPTSSATPTRTVTPTATPTGTPSATPSPSPTPGPTASPSPTPAPMSSATPPPTATVTADFWSTATTSPQNLVAGAGMETIAATVTASQAASALVDVEVYNTAGQKVFQQWFDDQAFDAGQSQTYTVTYQPGRTGTYTVKVGVFSVGWGILFNWNDNAALFTVTS
jgi:hypothetical protein